MCKTAFMGYPLSESLGGRSKSHQREEGKGRLQLSEAERLACLEIGEALDRFLQELDVDALALYFVITVEDAC